MAIIKTGFLSPFKNKLGNGVGRRWRNLNIVAEYNGSPRNPRTTAQQIQRARFATLSELARAFASTLKDSLGGICAGTKVFPRAKFISLNDGAVTSSSPDTVNVDFGEIIVARGNVQGATYDAPEFDVPSTVSVSYDLSAFKAQYPQANTNNVKARIVVYSVGGKFIMTGEVAGDVSQLIMTVPEFLAGTKVHVYGYIRWDGDDMPEYGLKKGDVSDSMYIGQGNIG